MKKSIVFLSTALVALSLTAFGFINRNKDAAHHIEASKCQVDTPISTPLDVRFNVMESAQVEDDIKDKVYSEFFYDMGPRFEPIQKDLLQLATSINDFLSEEEAQSIVNLKSVSLTVIKDERQTNIREMSMSEILTSAQKDIIRSAEYSSHFTIRTEFEKRNMETGDLEHSFFGPHYTVVPEKQAVYVPGKHRLIEYLRFNNKEYTADLDESKMQPAMLYFTVNTDGSISNVNFDRTSGFLTMDKHMINLITNAPGKWQPAENSNGEKVAQELVISLGIVGLGC